MSEGPLPASPAPCSLSSVPTYLPRCSAAPVDAPWRLPLL